MTSSDYYEKKLEEMLQIVESLPISLLEIKKVEDKYKDFFHEYINSGKFSEKGKELLKKIRVRVNFIFGEFIDKVVKGEIELIQEEEEEAIVKFAKDLIDPVFGKNFPEEERELAGENIKKAIDWKIGRSNQLSSSKDQSNKKNYPWGIIIGMGAIIAALLGVIVFLLIKNKKNVKN